MPQFPVDTTVRHKATGHVGRVMSHTVGYHGGQPVLLHCVGIMHDDRVERPELQGDELEVVVFDPDNEEIVALWEKNCWTKP